MGIKMPYYHLRIRYEKKPTGILSIFGDSGVIITQCSYNWTENKVKTLRDMMKNEEDILVGDELIHHDNVKSINVFKTEKNFTELLHLFNGDNEVVRIAIFDGKIAENVTSQYFDYPIMQDKKHYAIDDLEKSVQPLGLDRNWFVATYALQLQEVIITIIAEKLGIILDKANVERILKSGNSIEGDVPFKLRYRAFSKEVKKLHNLDMPIMYEDMRTTRWKVLHLGQNPTSADVDAIVAFTIGLFEKLSKVVKDDNNIAKT
jgi:hypothetical protein